MYYLVEGLVVAHPRLDLRVEWWHFVAHVQHPVVEAEHEGRVRSESLARHADVLVDELLQILRRVHVILQQEVRVAEVIFADQLQLFELGGGREHFREARDCSLQISARSGDESRQIVEQRRTSGAC